MVVFEKDVVFLHGQELLPVLFSHFLIVGGQLLVITSNIRRVRVCPLVLFQGGARKRLVGKSLVGIGLILLPDFLQLNGRVGVQRLPSISTLLVRNQLSLAWSLVDLLRLGG
mmetsp:Transcript_33407/g.32452  ORF Transcript_33407/g.32452 Transcript_33407/m.32452 type:complete len:112 (+) Transcript_33407:783-1118(+)